MSRELDKLRNERAVLRTVEDRNAIDFPTPWTKPGDWGNFITFRYSSAEIFSENGDLHVKVCQTRFQNGRLVSEECEGMLDHRAYEQVVREAQGYFLNQVGSFMRLLCAPFLLPMRRKDDE